MKTLFIKLTAVAVLSLQFACCGQKSNRYTLVLPETPQAWELLPGEPHWRIEWLEPDGQRRAKNIAPGETFEVEIPATWTNPVIALPWWPDKNLIPGLFKPAGALFPYDVSGGRLYLTWEAGVDAFFYFELAFANNKNAAKIPSNFNWIRFRELFNEPGILSEDVYNDPWLIDWRYTAEKTIDSNFDRRRLVPQAAQDIEIPLPARRWYGSSPFAQPLVFSEDEPSVFQVYRGVNVWISAEGILRCDGKIWFFTPFE